MVTREQQTALHIRQHAAAKEATEEGCGAGEPSGRVPAPGGGHRTESQERRVMEKLVLCAFHVCDSRTQTTQGSQLHGWRQRRGCPACFFLGLNFGSLGLENTYMSFLWQELLGIFAGFPRQPRAVPPIGTLNVNVGASRVTSSTPSIFGFIPLTLTDKQTLVVSDLDSSHRVVPYEHHRYPGVVKITFVSVCWLLPALTSLLCLGKSKCLAPLERGREKGRAR